MENLSPGINPYGSSVSDPSTIMQGTSQASNSSDLQSLFDANPMLAIIMSLMGGGQQQNPSPLAQAATSLSQQSQGKQALRSLVSPGDLNAYTGSPTGGSGFENRAQTLVPFLQDQEKSVQSKQQAAQKAWTASHGPGSQAKTSLGAPVPAWLKYNPDMSSDTQDAVLAWHQSHPEYDTPGSGSQPSAGDLQTTPTPYGNMETADWSRYQRDHASDNYNPNSST